MNDVVREAERAPAVQARALVLRVMEPKRYVPTRQPPGFVATSFGVTPSSWNMNV